MVFQAQVAAGKAIANRNTLSKVIVSIPQVGEWSFKPGQSASRPFLRGTYCLSTRDLFQSLRWENGLSSQIGD